MKSKPFKRLVRTFKMLDLKFDIDEEQEIIHTGFTGEHQPYGVKVRADRVAESKTIVRLTAFASFARADLPPLLLPSERLDEAIRFTNVLNAGWLTSGALYIDLRYGDLCYVVVVPTFSKVTPELVRHVLAGATQVEHFWPEYWAILRNGMVALDAIEMHRERDREREKADEGRRRGRPGRVQRRGIG